MLQNLLLALVLVSGLAQQVGPVAPKKAEKGAAAGV